MWIMKILKQNNKANKRPKNSMYLVQSFRKGKRLHNKAYAKPGIEAMHPLPM